METIDALSKAASLCETLTDDQEAMARGLMDHIAGKWPLWVLHVLAEAGGPLRFSRVLEQVEGISQKVLTQTLRQLERDGFVTRTLYAQVPPRVDYALTPLGLELLRQIFPLWHWLAAHLASFQQAQAVFDAKKDKG
jgi:DNA-binding HxlR family transcriptional regulator